MNHLEARSPNPARELETARLKMRQWRTSDLEIFAKMNADPRVMEYFPALLSRAESDAMVERMRSLIAQRGFGFWATELRQSGEFIGFVGLHIPSAQLPFSPCVEIGWRLGFPFWGYGYATEAAREGATFRLQGIEPSGDRFFHHGRQPALPGRDAATEHATRARNLSASGHSGRASVARALLVPAAP